MGSDFKASLTAWTSLKILKVQDARCERQESEAESHEETAFSNSSPTSQMRSNSMFCNCDNMRLCSSRLSAPNSRISPSITIL